MRYFAVGRDRCREIIRERMRDDKAAIGEVKGVRQGIGQREVDYGKIGQAADRMRDAISERPSTRRWFDHTEGECAVWLHDALRGVTIPVLEDPGFWRYLGLSYFWEFICWRQPTVETTEAKAFLYVEAENSREAVLPRMYMRALSVGLGDETGHEHERLASVLPEAADFWRSHVIRVRNMTAPTLVRAMIREQSRDRMSTPILRALAKSVNRTWVNIDWCIYSDKEAAEYVKELRDDVQKRGATLL